DAAPFFTIVILIYAPFLAFLRQYVISYNGVSIILLAALILWFINNRQLFLEIIYCKARISIIVFIFLFVAYGMFIGVSVERFMKFIETVLALLLFSMVLKSVRYVRQYTIYFIASSALIIISFLQHIDTRYVIETSDVVHKANPSALSIGLVLSAFFIFVDKKVWIAQMDNEWMERLKYPLLAFILVLTILTTSRIGFFMFMGSYLLFLILSKFSIKQFLPILVAVCLSFIFISNSSYSEITQHWFNKTFNNERGISSATSGRADQWKMAGVYLVSEPPINILSGFGPGKGPNFSRKFSTRVNAIESMAGGSHQLHSLYLNILIEYGLIAFVCFCFFLIKRFKKVFSVYVKLNYKLPLLALFGYMLYIGTTSGLGVIPGMFIALFLLDIDDFARKKKGIRIPKNNPYRKGNRFYNINFKKGSIS
uniref:O-antigen ligase family protein n=1 Tax=Ancylomarina sp. TaxID=1970196 RepID=UPI00356A167F